MWTAGTTQMIARVTGSTLFANQNLVSVLTFEHRSMATGSDKTSLTADEIEKNTNLINRMRELRARSPYASFVKDNYHDVSAKYPDLKLAEITKKIAELWKNLPVEKKQTYSKKSQDQKVAYEQEKQRLSPSDLQTIDAAEKAKKIEHRIKKSIEQLPTKRPRAAYAHFLSTLDRGEATLKDFMAGAAKRWAQMSVQEKQQFEDLHQEEKQAYIKALAAWDATQAEATKKRSPRSSSLTATKRKALTLILNATDSSNSNTQTATKKKRAASATGKQTVKKRASGTSKTAASIKKTMKSKATQTTSDKEVSSSDDESSPKKVTKSTSPKKKDS
ncbi:unnamed protein product [Adineta ricciae]|uniref:HMG box domain-containing protein n=1 Tax=Adineta ricciae TaxID=249248 RepID=A0A815S3G6_ADIRI|nr:unnamed protein product [Adineta ricciae]